jgi:hypothetical protein
MPAGDASGEGLDKLRRRCDAHSHGWVQHVEVYCGGRFGGFLGEGPAVLPKGDGARSGRAAKDTRQRSRESNFWLPRVAARGFWPVFVVALGSGLVTKPAPWDAHAGAWPSTTFE